MLKILVGIILLLIISLDVVFLGFILPQSAVDGLYNMDSCLSDKRDFICCIFQWQLFVWEETKDTINMAGIIILEILMTAFALPYNIIALIALVIGEIIRFVIWCFVKCFGKRYKNKY